ncbi:MAG: type II toxin-antitoxin system VapC family toxin [Truepera sp.]|nr:type II toxin-antitoxin system VapC family toxin [Truepera sp.]
MNGERYLLDTSAVISLLAGNKTLAERLERADWIGLSIITQLEFLVFPELTEADKSLFEAFAARVEVVGLTTSQKELLSYIIELRGARMLKLPDAIIAGTARHYRATLVTEDRHFSGVPGLDVLEP